MDGSLAHLTGEGSRRFLRRYAWLSIGAAVGTMAIKTVAYLLTGSVGLLSDAVESIVNLVGALMALWMLTIAAREPDEEHAYGHSKAEYFSSGVEGTLIVIAALSIGVAAVRRLMVPRPIEDLGFGLLVSSAASIVNLITARVILAAGRRFDSVTLQANAHHLMTDVWTSVGVLAALGAVYATGWHVLDPIVALGVAVNIVITGVHIVNESIRGLMDTALPLEEQQVLRAAIEKHAAAGVQYHALRSRQSGSRKFISVHVLVPGDWTVHRGHELLEEIEHEVRTALPGISVFTHLESLEDPASWEDQSLDRSRRK
jgi:cation diffusion facilitator family transporter